MCEWCLTEQRHVDCERIWRMVFLSSFGVFCHYGVFSGLGELCVWNDIGEFVGHFPADELWRIMAMNLSMMNKHPRK